MLVVTLGDIVFTRAKSLRQNGVDVVERWPIRSFLDEVSLELDFAMIRQVHLPRRPENSVLIDFGIVGPSFFDDDRTSFRDLS